MRRHRCPRRFGNMRVIRLEGENALAAETRGQAIHQKADVGFLVDAGVEISHFASGAFHPAGGKPDEIETETGIKRIGKRIQLFAEEPFDDGGLAGGHTHVNGDAAHRAIGPEEHGLEAACALRRAFPERPPKRRRGI